MIEFQCVGELRQNLAEGPVWSPRDQALCWVDIRRPTVHRFHPGSGRIDSWTMPSAAGSLAVRQAGGLVVALRDGLASLDPATGKTAMLAPIEPDKPENRCNDGKCDRSGRFWVGTIHDTVRGQPVGALYRVGADHQVRQMADAIIIPNSLAWSPDDRTLYFADTFRRVIYAYDYDLKGGEISQRRVFAEFAENAGVPDGSTVDADGFLWNAVYGGSRLHRYAPDGRLDRTVPLPMSQPTSCAFGGADLATLYVTSASQRLTAEQLQQEPFAGAIIAIDVGVKGLPEPYYAG